MKPAAPKRLGAIGACGVALFAYGLGWEVIADYQKYSFKNDAANQGKFCNQGLSDSNPLGGLHWEASVR